MVGRRRGPRPSPAGHPRPRRRAPTSRWCSDDERYSIVFNGEIYNFRDLRASLERQGVLFRTTSDTEVLLALYAREGERMLRPLRGMFAFAIWDARHRELFLARDPYGIKPLYYSPTTAAACCFASQVKALLASGLRRRRPRAGWAWPAFISGAACRSRGRCYRDVFALPAGHWLQRARRHAGDAGLLVRHPRPLARERTPNRDGDDLGAACGRR